MLSLHGRGILQQRVLLSEPCVAFTRYFPSRVLLPVSLCLVHAGVPTSLNSVARLLLNAVYRLLLNVTDASLSFLPGTARTYCTSLHEGSLDLAPLHPTATQLGPINIFWTLLWLQLHLLNPQHLSFHCASFTVFCSLRSRRSPCLSTDSCTPRIVDTCRCDSTMFPSTRT